MMQIKLLDFSGEIEWFKLGAFLNIDKNYRALDDLIRIALPEVDALSGIVRDGRIDENEQVPVLKSLLKDLQHRYEQLYISDAQGNYFNADGQKNNIMDRSYFHLVMRGEQVVSEPIINKSTKRPCIAVATPVWNKRKVVGLFGATIPLDSIYGGLRFLSFAGKGKRLVQKRRRSGTAGHHADAKNTSAYAVFG